MVKLDSTISPHENITAFIYMANCSGFGFKCEHPMHWSAHNIVASKSALLTSAMICDVKCSNNERENIRWFLEFREFRRMRWQSVPGPLLSFGRRGLGTRLRFKLTRESYVLKSSGTVQSWERERELQVGFRHHVMYAGPLRSWGLKSYYNSQVMNIIMTIMNIQH